MSSDVVPSHAALGIPDGIHRIVAGTIANGAAQVAGTVADPGPGTRTVDAGDVDKVFRREDTGDLFLLSGDSPVSYYALGERRVRLAADVTNSTTTAADVTGLSVPVKAGVTYWIDVLLVCRSAATTTGIQAALNGPAFSQLAIMSDTITNATGRVLRNSRAWDDFVVGTAVDTANADCLLPIRCCVTPSADGDIVVRLRSEVAASAVTARAGSCMVARVFV